MKKDLHSCTFILFLTGICSLAASDQSYKRILLKIPGRNQSTNHAPVVKFILPLKNTVHAWNQYLPYSIEISDKEDGESKYQEIQSGEVLVKLKYFANATLASAYLKQKKIIESSEVNSMLVSNCFNCHAAKLKLAGPSFLDISKRYQNTINNRDQLVHHIQNGSKGIWGGEAMPSHPELSDTVARQIVKWILQYARDPGLNYFVGLEGTLPLDKPSMTALQGFFIVTAFYTDHGSPDFPDKKITGSDQLMIQVR
jgi:cytochrome c